MRKVFLFTILFTTKFILNNSVGQCPPPVAEITCTDTVICNSNDILISANYIGEWFEVGNNSSIGNSSYIVVYTPGTYYMIASDTCGIDTSNFIILSSSPIPIINGDTMLCAGSAITLTLSPTNADFIEWQGPNGFTSTGNIISINESGYYQLTAIYDGCSTYASKIINDVYFSDIVFNGSLEICLGDSVELIAPSSTNGYLWNTGATTQSIFANNNQEYFVTVYENNCSATLTSNVTIQNINQPTINGSSVICDSLPVTLSIDSAFLSVIWNNSETSNTIITSETGSYSAIATDIYGCNYYTDTLIVSASTAPVLETIFTLENTEFCEGSSITIYGNNNAIWNTGIIDSSLLVSVSGNYYQTISNECGSSISNIITVTASLCTNINFNEHNGDYYFFNNSLYFRNNTKNYYIKVFDFSGKLIFNKSCEAGNEQISLRDLKSFNFYLIYIYSDSLLLSVQKYLSK